MITKIHVKKFKSLKSLDYECAKLNVLTGLNGSGKSSLIQFILFLKKMMAWDDPEGTNCSIRAIPPDTFYMTDGRDTWRELSFNVSFTYHDTRVNFKNPPVREGVFKRSIQRLKDRTKQGYYSAQEDVFNFDTVKCEGEFESEEDEERARDELLEEVSADEGEWMCFWKELLDHIRFVDACRQSPTEINELSSDFLDSWEEMDPAGNNAAELLATVDGKYYTDVDIALRHPNCESATLKDQVNAWLGQEVSPGAFVETRVVEDMNVVLMRFGFASAKGCLFRPENVGTGLSNVLPVLLTCLTARKGDTLLIENPELHLHPRGQAKVGELIARAVAAGAQVFVETHSDHVINGMRVAVKKGIVKPQDVNIAFFTRRPHKPCSAVDKKREVYTEVSNIKVDGNGSLSEYPEDFMDEWNNQLMELLK
ncbi:MAG: DUF3696 domain-containing protein [Kiritimatiellae bacterium]|nr:DUF3696 domain-containing protein [Kiritimatiellia bacterium]